LVGGVNVYAYTLNNPISYIDQYGLLGWDVLGYSFTTAGGIMLTTIATMSSAPAWVTPVGIGLIVGGWAISHWDSYSTARYYISVATNILDFYNDKFNEIDQMNDQNGGCGY
jgi:hypothetical protein